MIMEVHILGATNLKLQCAVMCRTSQSVALSQHRAGWTWRGGQWILPNPDWSWRYTYTLSFHFPTVHPQKTSLCTVPAHRWVQAKPWCHTHPWLFTMDGGCLCPKAPTAGSHSNQVWRLGGSRTWAHYTFCWHNYNSWVCSSILTTGIAWNFKWRIAHELHPTIAD